MHATSTDHDLALPPPEQLARGDFDFVVRRLADDLAFGSDNSRLLGSGLEYASSRPYQPGDSIRLLNWRLTARTGRAFVREYEALKRTSVYLIVDTSASMSVQSTSRSKHDLAIWIASALGLVAQRRMSPVAIIGAGERAVPALPSLRQSDLWQSIEPLRTRIYDEGTNLGARLTHLTMRATRSSVFVVLSDLHDPAALPAIRLAAQKHECLVIRTVDPAETEPLRAGFMRGREPETGRPFLATSRSAWADHEHTRGELLRAGADSLHLRTDSSFLSPLRTGLSSRGSYMRGAR